MTSAPGAGDGGGFPGGIKQSRANNQVDDANVTTIALELHKSCLTGSGNGVIGGWTSASLRQARLLNPLPTFSRPEVDGGPWVQVSRLGMPLVNELVIGLPDKDRFSASEPRFDGQFGTYVTNPTLPALLDALFRGAVNQTLGTNIANLAPNNLPRNDLATAFLTGLRGREPDVEGDAIGDDASQHRRLPRLRLPARATSAWPAAISRASRTAAVLATTPWTSRCAWSWGVCVTR